MMVAANALDLKSRSSFSADSTLGTVSTKGSGVFVEIKEQTNKKRKGLL